MVHRVRDRCGGVTLAATSIARKIFSLSTRLLNKPSGDSSRRKAFRDHKPARCSACFPRYLNKIQYRLNRIGFFVYRRYWRGRKREHVGLISFAASLAGVSQDCHTPNTGRYRSATETENSAQRAGGCRRADCTRRDAAATAAAASR